MEELPSCPQCGEPVQMDWDFCPNCGYTPGDVIDDAAPSAGRTAFAPPDSSAGGPVPASTANRGAGSPTGSAPGFPGAPSGGSGSGGVFAVDRRVAIGAIVGGLVIALIAAFLIMGRGGDEKATTTTGAGTTLPPIGAIKLNEQTTSTTSTTMPRNDCDSKTSQVSPDGKGYTPCDGNFVIDLPSRPQIDVRKEELQSGSITWTVLTSTSANADGKQISRTVVVYGDLGHEPTPEEASAATEAAMNQVNGKPGGATTFQGQPGIAFKGDDGQWHIQGVAFWRGTKVYALAVMGVAPLTNEFADLQGRFRLV